MFRFSRKLNNESSSVQNPILFQKVIFEKSFLRKKNFGHAFFPGIFAWVKPGNFCPKKIGSSRILKILFFIFFLVRCFAREKKNFPEFEN